METDGLLSRNLYGLARFIHYPVMAAISFYIFFMHIDFCKAAQNATWWNLWRIWRHVTFPLFTKKLTTPWLYDYDQELCWRKFLFWKFCAFVLRKMSWNVITDNISDFHFILNFFRKWLKILLKLSQNSHKKRQLSNELFFFSGWHLLEYLFEIWPINSRMKRLHLKFKAKF